MKKTKRKATLLVYAIGIFIPLLVIFTFSSIYLKQYNTDLAVNIQVTEIQIKSENTKKEALQVEIDKLVTKAKVVNSINSDEMEHNKDNIVYIKGSDE